MIVKRIYCECAVDQNVQQMFSESEGNKQRMCSKNKRIYSERARTRTACSECGAIINVRKI